MIYSVIHSAVILLLFFYSGFCLFVCFFSVCVSIIVLSILLQEDDANELYCRVCNQFFSSPHNKKEHLFGKQHLLMLTGEFEREAEQNANGTDKIVSDSPDLAPCSAVADTVAANMIPTESMLTISQFTEKFLEQNLSEYIYTCTTTATE